MLKILERKTIQDFNMEVIRIWKMKKVEYLINMINDMDIKYKLKIVIYMSQSKWSGFIYNTKEYY